MESIEETFALAAMDETTSRVRVSAFENNKSRGKR